MARKREKVLVACNTLTSLDLNAYVDHARFFYRLGRDYPKTDFYQFFARRMSIDRFRNTAGQLAVSQGVDYLMFIDDDMQLPHDSYGKLRAAKYDIIGALNYIRGYPFKLMSFVWDSKKKNNLRHIESDELKNLQEVFSCQAIGTAVALIKTDVFKKTPYPWFVTGPHNTEDIYFCMSAQRHNPKIRIGTHQGVVTGHLLDREIISKFTRDKLKAYYEAFMTPEQIELANNMDRGESYAKANIDEALENAQDS